TDFQTHARRLEPVRWRCRLEFGILPGTCPRPSGALEHAAPLDFLARDVLHPEPGSFLVLRLAGHRHAVDVDRRRIPLRASRELDVADFPNHLRLLWVLEERRLAGVVGEHSGLTLGEEGR